MVTITWQNMKFGLGGWSYPLIMSVGFQSWIPFSSSTDWSAFGSSVSWSILLQAYHESNVGSHLYVTISNRFIMSWFWEEQHYDSYSLLSLLFCHFSLNILLHMRLILYYQKMALTCLIVSSVQSDVIGQPVSMMPGGKSRLCKCWHIGCCLLWTEILRDGSLPE